MRFPTFRFVGRHVIHILSGIYLAAVLSYLVGKLIPAAQLPMFIALSLSWVLLGISFVIRELRGEQDSLLIVSIEFLPLIAIFVTVILVVASVIAHFEPVAILGPAIGILGTVIGILFYAAVLVGTVQKRRLEEDLANKPHESSNQAMQRTAGRSAF